MGQGCCRVVSRMGALRHSKTYRFSSAAYSHCYTTGSTTPALLPCPVHCKLFSVVTNSSSIASSFLLLPPPSSSFLLLLLLLLLPLLSRTLPSCQSFNSSNAAPCIWRQQRCLGRSWWLPGCSNPNRTERSQRVDGAEWWCSKVSGSGCRLCDVPLIVSQ